MSRQLLLRLLASAPTATDHVADAELLRRFVHSADPAAFELLVRRHADAVWATCRRMLRSDADAEDAFQATFLALLRNPKAVRTPSAGGWLHRVAVNVALKSRERGGRASPVEPDRLDALPAEAEPPGAECAGAVHEELARLPERERLPVVLCDLEGLSHADAAKALGWPIGTVSGRLSRARAKLRDRLARRGLAPSVLVPALGAPPHLIPKALSLTAGVAPPTIVSLTEGVLAMSTTATRKWVVLMVVCAGAFGAGGVFAFTPGKEPQPPTNAPLAKEQPAPRAPADDPGVWGDTDPKGKVPSAFPKLLPPELKGDKADLLKALTKACPEILGPLPNANADDDTSDEDENQYRRLLLTQLQQGRFESRVLLQKVLAGGATAETFDALTRCLTTMRATVLAFWGQERSQRLRLVSWMEEFVVLGKAIERVADGRAETDPRAIFAARGHRVAAEVALWKAKNKR